jgi:DNA-binding transcriptional MocR family regulator
MALPARLRSLARKSRRFVSALFDCVDRMRMRLYEDVCTLFESRIAEGVYRQGERLPSVRQTSKSLGVSMTTVYHAYNVLETKGLIRAKPQSGYFISQKSRATNSAIFERDKFQSTPNLETIAAQVLGASDREITAPFGSTFLDASLLPVGRVLSVMRRVARRPKHYPGVRDAAGHFELRREIAKRYALHGFSVPLEQIVVTGGTIDGINLALSALLRPGDAVAIEDPCFFATSFAARRFGLKLIPIPVTHDEGLDLDVLERVLARGDAKACLIMSSCQIPLGVTLSSEKKFKLVRLLERYSIPLIENDTYGELLPLEAGPSTCKAHDRSGLVLHCSSFSNSLSPELRVGWITAGRFRERILSLKFLTSITSHAIAQETVAEFLKHENVDHYLRCLRTKLDERRRLGIKKLDGWHEVVEIRSNPKHGYVVWVRLKGPVDIMNLFKRAAAEGISLRLSASHSRNGYELQFSLDARDGEINRPPKAIGVRG